MNSAREKEASFTRLRSNSKPFTELSERPTKTAISMDDEERMSRQFNPPKLAPTSTPNLYAPRKPLIDHCTNEWQRSSKYKAQLNKHADHFDNPPESAFVRGLSILKAPKIRRDLLFYTVLFIFSLWLWSSTIWPVWAEHRILSRSLSAQNRLMSGGLFGSNLRPTFSNMIQVKDMDPRFLPKASAPKHPTADNVNRLIFVGDVHGCLDELKVLMKRVRFTAERDHLITTGDLISKGPDSAGTVEFVRKLGASCVRGNHEDRILLTAQALNSSLLHLEQPGSYEVDRLNEPSFSLSDSPDRALARSLSVEQIAYLETCPVILRVGFMKHLAGDLVVVHAGLVPGVKLERQDPTSVMSMRSIDLTNHVPSKYSDAEGCVPWTKLWNKYQKSLPAEWSSFPVDDVNAQKAKERHITVIYGHDAKQGLQLKQYSKGIDTGCVKGGKLTALILSDGGAMQTIQVNCKDHR